MHNIKKILLSILLFFTLISYINAKIHNGDTITVEGANGDWIVKNVTEDKTCRLAERPLPPVERAKAVSGNSFAYTYENTCLDVKTKTAGWCSVAMKTEKGECDSPKAYIGNDNKNNIASAREYSTQSLFNDVTNKYKIMKIIETNYKNVLGFDPKGGVDGNLQNLDVVTDNASGTTGPGNAVPTANVYCNWFIDYYESVTLNIEWDCEWDESCNCSGGYYYGSELVPYTCETCHRSESYSKTEDHSGELNDCSPTAPGDYKALAKEKGTCPAGRTMTNYFIDVAASGEWRRASGSVSVDYCAEAGPTKVEVFATELTIAGKGMNKDAYCVNPALKYNEDYTWDNTFHSSKCVDSLHSVDSNGNLKYDMECGYVYIIAEAMRLNEIYCKGKENCKEPFSYSIISTAVQLFGTGITVKDESLPTITDINAHLQSAGYYTSYYGWGYGEWVGMTAVIPEKPSSWPSIYRYFMPKFYSIYIHTAEVAQSYLKNNMRYSDVGNAKCTEEYANKGLCSTNADGKSYIFDANYYLNHKVCQETFKNCNSSAINLLYNEGSGRIESLPETAGFALQEYMYSGNGQQSNCTDESGLGVLCGKEHENVTRGGKIPDSDYLDAIFLYIRALQGNKILYEEKIQNSINKYAPVEGLTKVIYNADGEEEGYTIRYKIDNQTLYENSTVECKENDEECEAKIYIYDAAGGLIQNNNYYDYCEKNYCYVKIKKQKVCTGSGPSDKITSVVVTDPNLITNAIKKIANGKADQQVLYVYDDTNSVNGGFCEEIVAVQEDLSIKCTCDPKEHPNNLPPDSNIDEDNYCKDNYNDYDELYYGDPSMSSIIYSCSDEDSNKFDFTDDLNANGNDLVHEGEQPVSKYSYQIKSDDFNVCTLYCRDESRLYLANKIAVRAGMNLKYDIGGKLLNKKIINETVNQRDSQSYKYMPGVVLQYRECTSVFDYEKWKKLYDKADNQREKNQLIYSAYNCNLYTTDEIVASINKGDIPDILGLKNGKYINKTGKEFADKNSLNNNYAEPAMIEYSYNMDDGKTTIVNDWGTTKDYLLIQEACTSIGKANGAECANYNITNYEDTYLDLLGINMNYEHGLVDSNLNITIHCTGESCYKLKGSDGNYYYNPYAQNKNDYTVIDERTEGNKVYHESGKILSYSEWALLPDQSDDYKKDYASKRETHNGYKIPKNEFSSFMVVTETGFYNDKKYYANRYDGEIGIEAKDDTVELDSNIYPLHLNKEERRYTITHKISRLRTAYQRSTYFIEKNYALEENISYNTDKLPSTFQYVCYYDVHNITTPPQGGELGFTYRIVDLEDVFASIPKDGESINGDTRDYPENWSTQFAKETLDQIENSSSNILMPENLANNESYLEYSYTLTKQGIIKIRNYNDSQKDKGGYLNNTLRNCEYDPEEEIFYNCDSSFLDEISQPNSEYYGNDLITINKDNGASEFCSSNVNSEESYCKYQKKESLTAGGNN